MPSENNEMITLIDELKNKIKKAQYRAMLKANAEMIQLYYDIGQDLIKQSQYGNQFIDTLAKELKIAIPNIKGFSARNLRYMKKFASEIQDINFLQTVSAKLPWSHNIVLIEKLKTMEDRYWYGEKIIENGWSLRVLEHQIATKLIDRQSRADKVQNFASRLPSVQSELAIQTMKDPYIFDFVEFHEGMLEREMENMLVANITNFLLEMGTGFAYIGHQKIIRVDEEEFAPDLLFYNTQLHCYVVIELKMTKFIPEYAGKMNFYLTLIDEQMKAESDNPSIGLILCRNKNKMVAEYALKDTSKPIGVSEYKFTQEIPELYRCALPDADAWEQHIQMEDIMGEVKTDDES
ncbi:MAG: PDDEXK nuclease domain-containing protein [Eubacteriales bacterium]